MISKNIYKKSWHILWQDYSIWFFVFLGNVPLLFPGTDQPSAIDCLKSPISVILFTISQVGVIGSLSELIQGGKPNIRSVWHAIRNNLIPFFISGFFLELLALVILLPFSFLALGVFLFVSDPRAGFFLWLLVSILLYLLIYSAVVYFPYCKLIIDHEKPGTAIREGLNLVYRNLDPHLKFVFLFWILSIIGSAFSFMTTGVFHGVVWPALSDPSILDTIWRLENTLIYKILEICFSNLSFAWFIAIQVHAYLDFRSFEDMIEENNLRRQNMVR